MNRTAREKAKRSTRWSLVGTALLVGCSDAEDSARMFGDSEDAGSGTFVKDAGTEDTEAAAVPASPDVHVVLTADNAYAFGWGGEDGPRTLYGRPKTSSGSDIFSCPINHSGSGLEGFGPEAYEIAGADAPESDYLYVVAWDDARVTQGVLGQFERKGGEPLYSGDAAWEVCATGKVYDSDVGSSTSAGPPIDVVKDDVGTCNRGSGSRITTSGGWVNMAGPVTARAQGVLAVGEANDSESGYFAIACQEEADGGRGIDRRARWMWYTPDARHAFSARGTLPYLIFRLPVKKLPPVR